MPNLDYALASGWVTFDQLKAGGDVNVKPQIDRLVRAEYQKYNALLADMQIARGARLRKLERLQGQWSRHMGEVDKIGRKERPEYVDLRMLQGLIRGRPPTA